MDKNMNKLQVMKEVPMKKALLMLGIPTMIGMLVSSLYSVVDAYFVGGLGESQMGAVSIVFPIVQLTVGIGMMFGSGAGSYISRLLGENEHEQANRTASIALFAALIMGGIAIVISILFLNSFLTALGATDSILPYAREYALIFIPGAIFNIFNVCMNNIVVAEGRAKLNLIAMLLGCGLNVVLDPIFIYLLELGIRGAAIATVIAQIITMIMYLIFIIRKRGVLRISISRFSFDATVFKEIISIGLPIFMFQLVSSISMSMSNAAAKNYGDSAVAAIGVVTRIMTMGTYVVFGFLKGFQPIAGYNYGAKQYNRVKEAIWLCMIWCTGFCTIIAILFIIFPTSIISLFSKDGGGNMVSIGSAALRANAFIFPLFAFQMVFMYLFLSIGKSRQGGLLSCCRQGLFFIPTILLLPHFWGINGIIWAQPIADVITVLLTGVFATFEIKRLNQLQGELSRGD